MALDAIERCTHEGWLVRGLLFEQIKNNDPTTS
jgi:hypothetical protein